MGSHQQEVRQGRRFEFGKNWARFLALLDDGRIARAEQSLRSMLSIERLEGARFLDIGSGSGLFSLAARRLGASVHSFDYDPQSVACTCELKRRYFPDDPLWTIEEGSALDAGYLTGLGKFDIVYSWGVLHHTGAMWQALENAIIPVKEDGRLFVAVYNDQGGVSRRWRRLKNLYCRSPRVLRPLIVGGTWLRLYGSTFARDLLRGKPFHCSRGYSENSLRGMSLWIDLEDWVGGYPFEVAGPGEIFEFYARRGFHLTRMNTTHTLGCNEFVFTREASG